jgi:hypothetical protein
MTLDKQNMLQEVHAIDNSLQKDAAQNYNTKSHFQIKGSHTTWFRLVQK